MSQRKLLGLLGLVVVVLLGMVVFAIAATVSDASSREYHITIPEGTGEQIAAGQDPGIIPDEIHLTLGEKDILVIENKDITGHQISDFWVGAGETLRQEFHNPAIYKGVCSVHPNAQIQIIIGDN